MLTDKLVLKTLDESAGFNGNRIRQYTGIVGEYIPRSIFSVWYDSGSLIEDLKINNKTKM